MEALNNAVSAINRVLWSSVIIVLLVGAGFYFTVRTRGVQIRFFGRMFSLIAHTAGRKTEGNEVSPFHSTFLAFLKITVTSSTSIGHCG